MSEPIPTLNESYLTTGTQSPFLPGTKIQYAWDSTSLGYLKTCPRLYQYIMLEGWGSRDESVHLRFGAEYHSALEHHDHCIARGLSRTEAMRSTIQHTLTRITDWHPDTETKSGKYKNRETLLSLIIDYLDHFSDDPAQTYIKTDGTPAVELSFRFELDFGPTEPQPYLLCGHLDRVVNFNDQLLTMDRKTTTTTLSAYYFAQYEPSNQMTLYTLAGRVILDAPVRGVIIDAAQIKLSEPHAFARGFTYRTDDQLDEWLADLRTTLTVNEAYAEADHWPMNDTACDKFGGCRFRGICSKSPAVRPRFLAADFDKLEPEERWNPLRAR